LVIRTSYLSSGSGWSVKKWLGIAIAWMLQCGLGTAAIAGEATVIAPTAIQAATTAARQ
jgi:hypothetical protein